MAAFKPKFTNKMSLFRTKRPLSRSPSHPRGRRRSSPIPGPSNQGCGAVMVSLLVQCSLSYRVFFFTGHTKFFRVWENYFFLQDFELVTMEFFYVPGPMLKVMKKCQSINFHKGTGTQKIFEVTSSILKNFLIL